MSKPGINTIEYLEQQAAEALRNRSNARNWSITWSLGFFVTGIVLDFDVFDTRLWSWITGCIISLFFALLTGRAIGKYTAFVDIHRSRQTYVEVAKATTVSVAYQAMDARYNTPNTSTSDPTDMIVIDGLYNPSTQELNVWDRLATPKPGFHATINMAPDTTDKPAKPDTNWIKTQTVKERDQSG